MTLRDEIASALGPGNDDATAYAQADSVLEILEQWDAARSEAGDTPWDDAARRIMRPRELDLNDPATENLVADAIRRLAPEGAYVPLHVRYPWRFSKATAGGTSATLVDAVVTALRGSAEVHEAEMLPHLVPALLALAEALERGALVPGPPPGRCGVQAPFGRALTCDLRAGHAGQHEGADWEAMRGFEGLAIPSPVHWDSTDPGKVS